MHKFEKYMALYSIIAITVLIVGAIGFLPRPHNYIMLGLFLPIATYFWLRITNPESVSTEKWSIRLLIVIVLISGLGIFGYNLINSENRRANEETEINKLKAQISILQKDLNDAEEKIKMSSTATSSAKTRNEEGTSIADVLGDSPKEIIGYVAANSGTVDIYKEAVTGSEVLTQMDKNINYPFYEKKGDYYNISLSEGVYGYVKVNLVKQVVISP